MRVYKEDVEVKDIPSSERLDEFNRIYKADKNSIYTIIRLKDTAAHLVKAMDVYLEVFGLTTAKFTVLMYLEREERRCLLPSRLAEMTGVTRGSISILVTNLEHENLVKRNHETNDRRQVTIYITEKGIQLLSKVLPIHFQNTKRLLSKLDATQKVAMIESLDLIETSMKEFFDNMED